MVRFSSKRWTVSAVIAALFLGASVPILAHKGHDHQQGKGASATAGGAAIPNAGDYQDRPREDLVHWGADYFPNVTLITHEGKEVRFFDDLIKGKVVSINFIYTSCPDSCPVETARLVQVQRILGERVGRNVFMYSITIDPKNDTPEALNAYAKRYGIGPGWLLLTGKEEDITLLRRKLGMYNEAVEQDTNDHSLSLLTGNQATNQWKKRSPFENPYILAEQLGSWLHNWKYGSVTAKDYAEAPLRVAKRPPGEGLFANRCAVCHTIGGGDLRNVAGGSLGPDLLGVTERRERDWLVRWLANPEKMLAAKDPIALELYARYNNVIMPNFGLTEHEIAALIDYIKAESRRIGTQRGAATASK